MRDKLFIEDRHFAHSVSSSYYNQTKNFDWVRDYSNDEIVVVTDLRNVTKYPNKKVYGWLIEPPTLIYEQYQYAVNNHNKFEKIFTYDKNLLNISNVFHLLPIGGCWINKKERKIYEKNKNICTIASSKMMLSGHRLRHEIIRKIPNIDVFGFGYRPIKDKVDILRDYKYSIVVENEKMDYLFTEKINDCFQTGTIPIYYGCPSIGDFFDINGFYTFNSIDELQSILDNINEDDYKFKIEIINKNFELSKKYLVADDLIYEYIKL